MRFLPERYRTILHDRSDDRKRSQRRFCGIYCGPIEQLRELTRGRGVDVALELIGLPLTMRQAVQSLAVLGRAALVGLTQETFEVAPYSEIVNKEGEIIGVSDHLASEIPMLLDLA